MLQGEIVGPFALVKDALWKFITKKSPFTEITWSKSQIIFKKGDKLIN
jgi:hypothetical protein